MELNVDLFKAAVLKNSTLLTEGEELDVQAGHSGNLNLNFFKTYTLLIYMAIKH